MYLIKKNSVVVVVVIDVAAALPFRLVIFVLTNQVFDQWCSIPIG